MTRPTAAEPHDAARAWKDAVVRMGGRPAAADRSGREFVVRYGEGHRRYHTLDHVRAVLADAADLADELNLTAEQKSVLALAVCAHDVIYDAQPGDDERASADWSRAALGAAGAPASVIDRIAALVLGTATHDADPNDLVEAALSDADLAILGADPATYDRYVVAVRQEFSAVSDEQWRAGRTAVLRALTDRPRLYVTDGGRRRWEAAARTNLAREQAELRRASTSSELPAQ